MKKSKFNGMLALLMCLCVALSAMNLTWFKVDAASNYRTVDDLPRDAMHFIITNWHTSEPDYSFSGGKTDGTGNYVFAVIEGYIVPDPDTGRYRFYLVEQGSRILEEITDAGVSEYIADFDLDNGVIRIKANPIIDGNGEPLEYFSGFSISAGRRATVYDSSSNTMEIVYSPDVHLVKAHAFYISQNIQDAYGTADETLFKYFSPSEIDALRGELVDGKLIAAKDQTDTSYTKYYNTQEGLHTDKTASAYDGAETILADGRTFNIDLEAWYNDESADVGMILDASGSMAFAAESPMPIRVSPDVRENLAEKVGALEKAEIPDVPMRNSLIGFYPFTNNSLLNRVTGGKATEVKQFNAGSKGSAVIQDGKLIINGSSSAGIKLDAVPTDGNFTVSFTVYKSGSGDASGDQNPADILYIGSTEGTGDYLRVIREGRITNGATGPHGTVRRAWLTGWQGNPDGNAALPDSTVSSVSVFHNGNPHNVTYVFKDGTLTSYFDGTNELDITSGAETINPTKALNLSDRNIIFNAFNTDYNGTDIIIDNIIVYDTPLDAAEVRELVAAIDQGADIDKTYGDINWNKIFLTNDEVNQILNPYHTDNSLLGVSGYSYFVYDPRDSAREYTPLGYWEGMRAEGLIGHYTFDNNSLMNSITGEYATEVWQQTAYGNRYSSAVIRDGRLVINGSSSAGIKLDAVPTGGSFTVSFKIAKSSSGDASGDQYPADILYVGDIESHDEIGWIPRGNYLRVIREGRITGGATGPHGTVRRAWLTVWRGNPDSSAALPDSALSSISAFHNTSTHTVTYVYQNGYLTSYFDGTQDLDITNDAQYINPRNSIWLSGYNMIFNAFDDNAMFGFDNSYNGADIYIDDIYVYDRALSASEVRQLSDSGTDIELAVPKIARAFRYGYLRVLGELLHSGGQPGWYYVTHAGDWAANYANPELQTGKRLVGIPSGATVTDDFILPSDMNGTLPGGGTGTLYTAKENTPVRFYIDGNGYLRCFFCSGKAVDTNASYVYMLEDDQYVKTEALQRALGSFVTTLSQEIPDSLVSAVRFSTDEIPDEELEKLVLLDWTNNPTISAGIMSIMNGDGSAMGYTIGRNNVKQYNYGLTGSTSTWHGLQAYVDFLRVNDSTHDRNPDNDDRKKYLIIFTDGKDTDRDGEFASKAEELANKLKEEDYTIFTVLLAGGPVLPGNDDYEDAKQFLLTLAGTEETDTSEKDRYFFSTADYEGEGANRVDALVEIFTERILRQIIQPLDGYIVQDYIDPRFDLINYKYTVDEDGNVIDSKPSQIWKLMAGGRVRAVNMDGTVDREFTVTNTTGAEFKCEAENTDRDAATAMLYYNAAKDMYYVQWTKQDIPKSSIGAVQLSVWNARFTLRAKEDFIGGNAVLTNGNEESMNYLYFGGNELDLPDFDPSSGTNKSVEPPLYPSRPRGYCWGTTTGIYYPSKGFPRTVVNVPPLETSVEGEQLIYMGENLTERSVVDQLKAEFEANKDAYLYWEYLERFANFDGDLSKMIIMKDGMPNYGTTVDALLQKIIDNGELWLPYSYLDNADKSNQTGKTYAKNDPEKKFGLHTNDHLGYLIYTWDAGVEYPNGETTDTITRNSSLSVTFEPLTVDKRFANWARWLITEHVYEWDPTYKPAVGDQIEEDEVALGDYETQIVSGDIVVQMSVEKDVVNPFIGYESSPVTITYMADLYRTYNDSKVKVGTYTVTYTVSGELATDATATGTISLEPGFAAYVEQYGLPIGTYTLEENSNSSTGTQWLRFGEISAVTITEDDNDLFVNDNLRTDADKEAEANEYAAPAAGNTAYLGTNPGTGTAYTDDLYALFVVALEPIDLGELAIEKQVTEDPNEKDEFSFTIELTLPEGFEDFDLSKNNFESDNITSFALSKGLDGKWRASVKLRHDWDITIKDIPEGTAFAVTEGKANGYDLQKINASPATVTKDVKTATATGDIVKDETAKITFFNEHAPYLPELGGIGVQAFYLAGGILLLSAVLFLGIAKRKKRAN